MKQLGILGGMGPRATANFYQLLVAEFNKKGIFEDVQFPQMIMLSMPLEDWDNRGARDKQKVRAQVLSGLDWLRAAGAHVIAVPCNTVHEFFDGDESIVNIVDASLGLCAPGRVGVFCSHQAREAGLYERTDREVQYYSPQEHVDEIIQSVQYGTQCDIGLMINAQFNRCSSVVLGCTELSLCSLGFVGNKHVVDSAQALAQATVARFI